MTNIQWKYVKKIIDETSIARFETKHSISLPSEYKESLPLFNGGRPNLSCILTEDKKERVFKAFLSFNETDKENIFAAQEWLKSQIPSYLIAFANDPAGNYFCFDYSSPDNIKIVYWEHENQNIVKVCDHFSNLLDNFY